MSGEPGNVLRSERPLRILRLSDKLGYGDQMHGVGRLWLATLPTFDARRCQVVPCVMRLSEGIAEVFQRRGIPVRHLNERRFDPTSILRMGRLIRRERIDLLHLEGVQASTIGRLIGRRLRIPAVIHHHDTVQPKDWPLLRYVSWTDRWLAPATAGAIAVSEAVARVCTAQKHIPRERITVIPNVVEPGWAEPVSAEQVGKLRASLGLAPGLPVIGAVTRFWAEKDVPTLLSAVAHLRDAGCDSHVVLVGDGPERAQVERQRSALGLQARAHLVGFQQDVRPYLALMDVVAFTGLTEGFSLALLEAMMMARPVVVVEGPMTEVVQHAWNGLVVPASNPERLAEAIGQVLGNSAMAHQLGRQAERDTRQFSVETHVEHVTQLYEGLIRDRVRDPVVAET